MMTLSKISLSVIAVVVIVLVWCDDGRLRADVRLPAVIGSNMVLQQGCELPIWGWADAGEEVSVNFAGQTVSGKAGADGKWKVRLSALQASSSSRAMTIRAKNSLRLTNVLVGEVWICSGQSNMAWTLERASNARREVENSYLPGLRLITVPPRPMAAPADDFEGQWVDCAPLSAARFSAVGYFFGRELRRELGVPVGLVNSSYGGTRAEAWTRRGAIESEPSLKPILEHWDTRVASFDPAKARADFEKRLESWRKNAAAAKAAGKKPGRRPRPQPDPATDRHRPANLYNGMLAPLIPFAIRGAIWYQGESNASRAYQYRTVFTTMIRNWREDWGQGDLSFYWVQLANFGAAVDEPGESDWAELREAQSMALALPATGEAVIVDIGEARDIHPRNKQDVGHRLALWALKKDYGRRDLVHSGPRFRSADFRGGEIHVSFDHTGDGLVLRGGGELMGFAVAGEDCKFHRARASIVDDTVVLRCEGVGKPVAVRYGWANNPRCNLYNLAGLPASPFRTDSWDGVTVGKVVP